MGLQCVWMKASTKMDVLTEKLIYWGIQCRKCDETIALGIRLDPDLGDVLSFLKPGTFRCVHGHTHNYHSDDVHFFPPPQTQITKAGILKNRANYKLLDQSE